MTLLYTYNPSYAVYEIREATTLMQVGVSESETEARGICASGTVPTWCQIVH